jgi:hypothetical protein
MASRWWTLLAVCLSIFMLLLDITVVNEWESASSTQHLQQPRSASSSRGEAAPRQG